MQTDKLTAKQTAAIAALLSEPSVKRAAARCQISERQLHRWICQVGFAARLKEARGRIIEVTLSNLQSASSKAVETLNEIMCDPDAGPTARVSAARTILEMTLRANDSLVMSERLAALEAKLGGMGQSR